VLRRSYLPSYERVSSIPTVKCRRRLGKCDNFVEVTLHKRMTLSHSLGSPHSVAPSSLSKPLFVAVLRQETSSITFLNTRLIRHIQTHPDRLFWRQRPKVRLHLQEHPEHALSFLQLLCRQILSVSCRPRPDPLSGTRRLLSYRSPTTMRLLC
jgi:hypothetical protein